MIADQRHRHALGQMHQARLAGRIGVRLLHIHRQSVDRGDVDHLGQFVLAACSLQRLMQRLGQEKRCLDVDIHHLVPTAFREGREIFAPCGAGIVDQNIEARFAREITRRQRFGTSRTRDVAGQRDACTKRRQPFRRRLAGTRLARCDVDLGTGLDETFSDHLADATRPARDQCGAAFDGKQIGHVARVLS